MKDLSPLKELQILWDGTSYGGYYLWTYRTGGRPMFVEYFYANHLFYFYGYLNGKSDVRNITDEEAIFLLTRPEEAMMEIML